MNRRIKNIRIEKLRKAGFTLLISIIVTSMLLVVSFVVVNIALKQLVLASSSKESQYAFYAADAGTECAIYWDLKANSGVSSFDINNAGTVQCNGQTISTNSQSVPTIPAQPSLIGGGGVSNRTSIFSINFTKGCAIIRVTKNADGTTLVDSRGYNTCDTDALRRFERGVTLAYDAESNPIPPPPPPPPSGYSVDYLVVAGGGGGGGSGGANSSIGAGGGAGGMIEGVNHSVTANQAYVITVGAGGASDRKGNNSVFDGITAIGGGLGGQSGPGGAGGSGGGAGSDGSWYAGGAGTTGQGNKGGDTYAVPYFSTGGGGGAGGAGVNGAPSQSGTGGVGKASSISGASVIYAGGGGGGAAVWAGGSAAGAGGSGGGGGGGYNGASGGSPGTPNRGAGGGGSANYDPASGGGSGGSGIVIIRYLGAQRGTGGTVTSVGGYTIHTFTTSGTFNSGS